MMEKGDMDFSKGKGAKELFIIFLYMYAQYKAKEPSKGFMALIMEILNQAQTQVINRKSGALSQLQEAKKEL